MSQADELIDNLTNDDISTPTVEPGVEEHIVIGEDRFIYVPDSLKRIAVQYDHNVETVTFDCPRYWDGLDMSEMSIRINYLLADGRTGQYTADSAIVDESNPDIMHFTWSIDGNVTAASGRLSFLVCIVSEGSDGSVINHWNSELNRDMYVSEGLEGASPVADQYPDVITQLLLRMGNLEADAMTKTYVDTAYVKQIETDTNEALTKAKNALSTANKLKNVVECSVPYEYVEHEGKEYYLPVANDLIMYFEDRPVSSGVVPIRVFPSNPRESIYDSGMLLGHYTITEGADYESYTYISTNGDTENPSTIIYSVSREPLSDDTTETRTNIFVVPTTEEWASLVENANYGSHALEQASLALANSEAHEEAIVEIQTQMGDIETALDSIIAIQESLIGGETA